MVTYSWPLSFKQAWAVSDILMILFPFLHAHYSFNEFIDPWVEDLVSLNLAHQNCYWKYPRMWESWWSHTCDFKELSRNFPAY